MSASAFLRRLGEVCLFVALGALTAIIAISTRIVWEVSSGYLQIFGDGLSIICLLVVIFLLGVGGAALTIIINKECVGTRDGGLNAEEIDSLDKEKEYEAIRSELQSQLEKQSQFGRKLSGDSIAVFKINLLIASFVIPGIILISDSELVADLATVLEHPQFKTAVAAWIWSIVLSIFTYGTSAYEPLLSEEKLEELSSMNKHNYITFLEILIGEYRMSIEKNSFNHQLVTILIGFSMTFTIISILSLIISIINII